MTIKELVGPIANYIAAANAQDVEAVMASFNEGAVVRDEGRTIEGLAAIKAWKESSKVKYRYTVEPLNATEDGTTVNLRARVTGDFAGSPTELTYRFALGDGKIISLEIL